MSLRSNRLNKIFLFIAGWIVLWILLFEYVLPPNKYFPAPTVLLESFVSLWKDYDLGLNLISSVSVVYLSLITGFFLMRVLRNSFLYGKGFLFNFLLSIEWFSKYLPGIIIGILLIFWFPQSDYTEFIFAFALVFTSLSISIINLRSSINKEYSMSAVSLGASKNQISVIEFNSIIPHIIDEFFALHFYAWTMLIIFEFVNQSYGVGFILRQAFEFKDLSAFVAASIIIGLVIYLGTFGLKFLKYKFFSWS